VPIYVAMLRGVNVGGNPLKMDWLRKSCEEMGLSNVRTYVQSGNIVFSSVLAPAKLTGILKGRIDGHTRLPVPIALRSASEMERIVNGNPFLGRARVDEAKLHITFLEAKPSKVDSGKLDRLAADRDQYVLAEREVYLHCPINYGETKLSNAAIEKALAVSATTRNWKTVTTLLSMAKEAAPPAK